METNFGHILTAMVTPFKSDLSIDFEGTEKLVNHLVQTGTDTIVVAGTTGESPTLTHDEEREVCKLVQKTAGGKAKVVLGAGSNCTKTAVSSTKEAEKLGVDGILTVVPYYNKPNQKGLIEHFSQIAKATSLPIILYNIPGRTGITMQPETIAELANKFENIVANKDATGDLEITSQTVELCPKDFIIYSGDDSLTLPMLSVGATGVISVASHIVGNELKDMVNYFLEGKVSDARNIHQKLFPLFKALFWEPNPTCVKAALEYKGICKATLRPPLVALDANKKKDLEKLVDKCVKELVK